MIGIIWESVLRVPIYIILSEAGGGGVLGGPKKGQKKALSFCSIFDQDFEGFSEKVKFWGSAGGHFRGGFWAIFGPIFGQIFAPREVL